MGTNNSEYTTNSSLFIHHYFFSERLKVNMLFISSEMLLWQVSVATSPHVFVIATCIWLEWIIYLLVSWNKQLYWRVCQTRHLFRFYTYRIDSNERKKECVRTWESMCTIGEWKQLLITTLPRGKWCILIIYMLRWRKCASWWQHWLARATSFWELNAIEVYMNSWVLSHDDFWERKIN